MVERQKILEAVRTAIESAPERKFSESVDLTVNLKNIDMAQPKNRIDETILLPQGTGRQIGIVVLGKGEITTQAKEAVLDAIGIQGCRAAVEQAEIIQRAIVLVVFGWQAGDARLDAQVDVLGHQHDLAVGALGAQREDGREDPGLPP